MRETQKRKLFFVCFVLFLAVVRAPYSLLLLGWGAPQAVAEGRIGDVDDPDDDHEPGEADGMHDGAPCGWACEELMEVTSIY